MNRTSASSGSTSNSVMESRRVRFLARSLPARVQAVPNILPFVLLVFSVALNAAFGQETCQVCHEDLGKGLAKSAHRVLDPAKLEQGQRENSEGQKSAVKSRALAPLFERTPKIDCESCHGPGEKHAESASAADILQPLKLTQSKADATCLKCHQNRPTHIGRFTNSHAKDQVACTSCHSIHAPEKKAPAAQCSGCHISATAQFQKPYTHHINQGSVTCVDCHNPHGRPAKFFAANDNSCVRCHGDKRGPFTFEHAPMRTSNGGCTSCHESHGSANPRMLIRQEVRQLCLECHANQPSAPSKAALGAVPPAFHDLLSPRYRNCTVCHQKIHGSHVDRRLLR